MGVSAASVLYFRRLQRVDLTRCIEVTIVIASKEGIARPRKVDAHLHILRKAHDRRRRGDNEREGCGRDVWRGRTNGDGSWQRGTPLA